MSKDLNSFPVLTCLSAGSRSLTPSLECIPELGLVNFGVRKLSSPYIFMAHITLMSSPSSISPSVQSCLLTSTCRIRNRNINVHSLHACAQIFGHRVFLNHFKLQVPLLYYSVTTVCFIYLFIYSISEELFIYVTKCQCKQLMRY